MLATFEPGADGSGRLLPPSIRTVLSAMIKEGTPGGPIGPELDTLYRRCQETNELGRAIAEPPKQTDTYLLLWRKPEEWGTEIYDWVSPYYM